MDVISYSEVRAKLKDVMDRVVADKTEVIVTRQRAEAVVIISLSEWNSMVETAHLLSSPANADRLRRSIDQMNAGQGRKHAGTAACSPVGKRPARANLVGSASRRRRMEVEAV